MNIDQTVQSDIAMLQEMRNNLRKTGEKEKVIWVNTMIGELERKQVSIAKIAKDMIESNILIADAKTDEEARELINENEFYKTFVKESLTEDEIVAIIKEQQFASVKDLHQYFKVNYQDRYNGATITKLYNTK